MQEQQKITVGLGDRAYPIHIRHGLLEEVGELLARRKIGKRYGVISDERVAALYGKQLLDGLVAAGLQAELFTFPAGEQSKHLGTVGELASRLARAGFDRKDALIALGGGVTGDITGFLASIYLRGIPFAQIPTTLLAQVDSSVGGKTGVDIPEGKNLIGTFYQPKVVVIDPLLLSSLPEQEFLGGMAEVIKYGVIWDGEFFAFLEERRDLILSRAAATLNSMIAQCCKIKAEVVARDEREGDLRRILNFGHTIGHGVEAASRFTLIHGLAVAMGMRAAADLAVLSGLLAPETAARIRQMLLDYGLPTVIPAKLDRAGIKNYLQADKKTVGGRVFFVLPTAIGQVRITDQVDLAHIDAVLENE